MTYSVDLIPTMSSNSAPSGTVSASGADASYPAWKAFDKSGSSNWFSGSNGAHWLQYQFPSARVISQYSITAQNASTGDGAPTAYTFKGSTNGSTWVTLDTRTGLTWSASEKKTYAIANPLAYAYYRIDVTACKGSGWTGWAETEMMSYVGEIATIDGSYSVVRFLQSGEFVTPDGVTEAEVLVIGGGGGGGRGTGAANGGGGGGGYLTGTESLSGTMTAIVGPGSQYDAQGSSSSFGTLTAAGGGKGGSGGLGGAGGSGGGGFNGYAGGAASPSGQGNAGGSGAGGNGGGGGGAGGAGTSGSSGSHGGAGLNNDIVETGVDVGYAGGGAGDSGTATHGGGGYQVAGEANTGGGGGAQYSSNLYGGSGIVVVRYETPNTDQTGEGAVTLATARVVGTGKHPYNSGRGGVTLASAQAVGTGYIPWEIATGGIRTFDGDYTVHKFIGSGTFSCNPGVVIDVSEVLVVGGGGSSGHDAGGGGAGGYLTGPQILTGDMTVTVGNGGDSTYIFAGETGEDSEFGDYLAKGEGGGGAVNANGHAGGSGGGAGGYISQFWVGGVATPSGQGNDGGDTGTGTHITAGGGGGAASEGSPAAEGHGGAGGAGYDNDIVKRGTYVGYAGGGGGSFYENYTDATLGTATHGGGSGAAGVANTGGGGGCVGATYFHSNWSAGGSGIVVIRYLTPVPRGDITVAAATVSGEATVSPMGTGGVTTGAASISGVGGMLKNYGMGILTVGKVYVKEGQAWTPIFGAGAVTANVVRVSEGAGGYPPVGSGSLRRSDTKVAGVGTISAFTGTHLGVGNLTVGSTQVNGCAFTGPPHVILPPSAIISSSHSLIGKIAVSIGGVNFTPWVENLTFGSGVSGGYGTCSMLLRGSTPVPNYEDVVYVYGNAQMLYKGAVVNVPSIAYTGEFVSYRIVCEGPARDYGKAKDFAMMFSDRDLSAWHQIDCQNWGEAPRLEITQATDVGLRFQVPDIEEGLWPILDIQSLLANPEGSPGVRGHYHQAGVIPLDTYYGKRPPAPLNGTYQRDFRDPKVLWSAYYYHINDGMTADVITRFKAKARYDLRTPGMDAMTIDDLNQPILQAASAPGVWPVVHATPDPDVGYAYATFEQINRWTDFHGVECPGSLWAGIYACDNPRDLPVKNPVKMFTDPHLKYQFKPHTFTEPVAYEKDGLGHIVYDEMGHAVIATPAAEAEIDFDLGDGCKMLVFYCTYVPVQLPVESGYMMTNASTGVPELGGMGLPTWSSYNALNRIYVEHGLYCEVRDTEVLANGYEGNNDLGKAIGAITGGGEINNVFLAGKPSIKIEPYTSKLAAIEQLVGMSNETLYWGWDPDFFCVRDRGSVTFDDTYPGVTVDASIKNDGVVESATVIYSDAMGDLDDRRVLAAWVPNSKTFDIDGDGIVEPAETSGLIDASHIACDEDCAAEIAQSYINQRGGGAQWEGSIKLQGIMGAPAVKVGTKVTCGDVVDAIVTSLSCDVDSDIVTLSLGGTGYEGRFPSLPGQPSSAVPAHSAAGAGSPLRYMLKRRNR